MDSNTKKSLEQLMNQWDLNDDEKKLIDYSNTPRTDEINHSKVLTEFLLVKQIKISTQEMITSNKFLAEAENEQSNKMQKLTWALIGVGFLQVIAMILNLYVTYKT